MSDVLIAAVISEGGQIGLSYSDDGSNWGIKSIPEQSAAPAGLASFNGLLWVAFRANTGNSLLVSSSADWKNLDTGQSSELAPSLTVFQNKLWIAYIGEDSGQVELISSGDGKIWTKSPATGQSSKLAPSLTVFQNELRIAYIGEDTGHVEVISSINGTVWSVSTSTAQSSTLAPSATVFQNRLWIAYIGEASGGVEVISSLNCINWSASAATGQSSKLPASLAVSQSKLWIAYIGENSGNVELISSGDGATWSSSIDTGQPSQIGPSLADLPSVTPVPKFGGAHQYILASPQGDGWPTTTNLTLPAILGLKVTIKIMKELQFDATMPLGFQLNCCAPQSSTLKIGWQQYTLIMQPNSKNLKLHIQNFGPTNTSTTMYIGDSSAQISFPTDNAIPAHWTFQLNLTYMGNNVSGATCSITDENQAPVGTLSLDCIGLPLTHNPGKADATWLAPIVAFQLLVVGYAEGAHTTFTSGDGYIVYECNTPLVAANTWAGSACNGGGGTAESSNSVYSVLPDIGNVTMVQCFSAPPTA